MKTRSRRFVALAAVVLSVGASVGFAGAASAHPLGNATVNHYDGLHLYATHVDDTAIEDIAEIPTLQRKALIDTNGDGVISAPEAASYASKQCTSLARSERLTVGGGRAALSVVSSSYSERPGAIQLRIGRLVCDLTAPASWTSSTSIGLVSRWDSAGIGWHEITAVGTGVTLHGSPFPAASISDQLLHYPNNLLSSPLDVSSGTVTVSPGNAVSTYLAAHRLPGANIAVRALNQVSVVFDRLVGSRHLTFGVVALTVLLALLLGAGHACLPGHGKTIMAAYLVGRRGRVRDVVAVGATVTITHTVSVLVLGLLISVTAAFAPTQAEQDLAILSGLLVAGVGVGLLLSALRRRHVASTVVVEALSPTRELALTGAVHHHDHAPHDHAPHDQGEPHVHSEPHSHGFGSAHTHEPAGEPRPFKRGGLVGLGIAGGLVPSPSALLVLLAAVALGRGAFGVVLVLVYGLGMAGTLSVAGLALVKLRDRLARVAVADRLSRVGHLVTVLPFVTAGLVFVVGIALVVRALHGTV